MNFAGFFIFEESKTKKDMKTGSKFWIVTIISWIIVGSLDIFSAFVDYYTQTGKGPEGVLRYIASGYFGDSAFNPGRTDMSLYGLIFHYMIAFGFTLLFFLIYRNTKIISRFPVLWIIFYGIFMWFLTTQIIIPLSNTPDSGSVNLLKALKSVLILVFMISLPLYLIGRKYEF